ncbi:MAG: hypothetical protein ACOYZ6_17330 [Chloroflexota bacterium]
MKKSMPVLVILTLAALTWLGFMGGHYFYEQSLFAKGNAPDIPDTPEAKEIMKTVEDAYNIEVEAAHTFDLKKFPAVFINDPRFPVSPSTLQVVREMTDNLSLESAGYLDYKLAYYTWWGEGAVLLETLREKAKAENRELTKEEKQSLTDKYGRTAAPRPEGTRTTRKNPVKFISMEITDDIALVVIDDGPRTVELTLVLVDNHWYIAGIKGISIHP